MDISFVPALGLGEYAEFYFWVIVGYSDVSPHALYHPPHCYMSPSCTKESPVGGIVWGI